jgi:hypothetical protein
MANNKPGRKPSEESLRRTLTQLVAAGDEGVITRTKLTAQSAPGRCGSISLASEIDNLNVDVTTFANLERLQARGLAVRTAHRIVRATGPDEEVEAFKATREGVEALASGVASLSYEAEGMGR